MDKLPRRIYLNLATPAEKAIRYAILEVEKLPANTLLTKAVCLLAEAKECVSDFVDGIPAKEG